MLYGKRLACHNSVSEIFAFFISGFSMRKNREEAARVIRISFAAGEALLAALWLLTRAVLWLRRGRIDGRREAALLLMYLNLAVLLRFAFYPFSPVLGPVKPLLFDAARILPLRVNPVPLVRLRDYAYRRDLLINVLGNVGLFVPSGILYPILYPKLDSFWKAVAAGVGLSLVIELLQLPFFVRATDVDDLLLNILGCMIGYGIWFLLRGRKRRRDPAAPRER